MASGYPVNERIFILKGDETLGPFEIDEIFEGLERGELRYDDVCLREGAGETERIRQILDWDDHKASPPLPSATQDAGDEPGPNDPEPEEKQTSSRVALYHGHRSIIAFPLPFLGLVGGIVGAVWLYPAGALYPLSGMVIAVLSLTYLSLTRYTREYFITNRRVELVTGLIARSSKEVRITDIRAVNVTCEGIPGIFGVGKVDFFTIGDHPEVSFTDAWAAKEIKTLVRKLQDAGS
ncbi:MAG: PH domain-containing protein [Verrucomicrobiales bacterium]|nr:PH domain-containing protein [Verrucomicrobiales bacterium]